MRVCQRGAALPETALVLLVSLLVIFGASQMGIIAFSQTAADGAAFVGAHALAIDPTANQTTVIQGVFPEIAAGNISAPVSTTGFQTQTISRTVDGFLLAGLKPHTLTGGDIELKPAGAGGPPQPFSFDAKGTVIENFCAISNKTCATPSTRSVYLAQTVDLSGNGQGWNGPFKEWRCHQQYFASLNFPSTRPVTSLSGSSYDWSKSGTVENTIYNWDSGNHTCT